MHEFAAEETEPPVVLEKPDVRERILILERDKRGRTTEKGDASRRRRERVDELAQLGSESGRVPVRELRGVSLPS